METTTTGFTLPTDQTATPFSAAAPDVAPDHASQDEEFLFDEVAPDESPGIASHDEEFLFDEVTPVSSDDDDDDDDGKHLNWVTSSKTIPLSLASSSGDHVEQHTTNATTTTTTNSIWQRQAMRVAHRPCTYLWVALLISLTISVLGLYFGDFTVTVDNAGWNSRGTLIADRHTQFLLTHLNRHELFEDDTGEVWQDLMDNVQPSWETDDDEINEDDNAGNWRRTRRLGETTTTNRNDDDSNANNKATLGDLWDGSQRIELPHGQVFGSSSTTTVGGDGDTIRRRREVPFVMTPSFMQRKLQFNDYNRGVLRGCNVSWYFDIDAIRATRLWPVWRPLQVAEPNTLLRADVLTDLCRAEEITQSTLQEHNLCFGCRDDTCLPPYSIVLFVRLTVSNGLQLDCDELGAAWGEYTVDNGLQLEQELMKCTHDIATSFNATSNDNRLPDSCPPYFFPTLIDEWYSDTGLVEYTSSIFATKTTEDDINDMFDLVGSFGTGTGLIQGAYDTQYEDFVDIEVDNALVSDMALALGSALVTFLAILVHTRSPFLSVIGLLQIILSFPLAFSVYTFVGQLEAFPFLNFIGVFIVFALGADDIFVAVDKWKNARLEHRRDASVAEIAATALPDAAGAMFLTTLTTAIAFFGTAICPVAPLKLFAIFSGLLIVFDYIMCVVLVFPALCIYDNWRHRRNCCCRCHFCHSLEGGDVDEDGLGEDEKPSLIRRILTRFYELLHKTRYVLVVACVVALILSITTAAKMELPTSSDVRLLDSDHQFEKAYEWRLHLMSSTLVSGSSAFVMWGTTPADTGKHTDPSSFSQLVLDESFEPSQGQEYLRDFCDRFFANDWAEPTLEGKECPINRFDDWLRKQASSNNPERIYEKYCGGATGLPLDNFDECIYHWGQANDEKFILARDGKVEIMYFAFKSRVRYDSPFDDLENEWNLIEEWLANEARNGAPESVSGMFFTSEDFWWYDTNKSMLNTAYTAAAIAIGAAGAVILFSSRSVVLTIFSTFTIGYVLASVTASLVAIGWTLGL